MTTSPAPETSRLERILAFMLLGLVVASIVAFFAIMIGTWSGMARESFAEGAWPIVTLIPYIGLPAAIVVLIALMVIGGIRRSRTSTKGGDGAS